MNGVLERTRSVDDWQWVMWQLDATLQQSLDNLAAQESVLDDDVDDLPVDSDIEARLDQRLQQLSQRVAEAEASAAIVGAELAAAEDELRRWVEQLGGIARRIDIISQ